MIKEMIKKSDYAPIKQVDENKYLLMWGYTPVTDNVYQRDEDGNIVLDENQKPIVIGQEETDYCMVCDEVVKLPKNGANIVSIISQGNEMGYDNPSMQEWGEWTKVFVPEDLQLQYLKERLKAVIEQYDTSTNVNDFTINDIHLWLDSNLRTKVRENLESCEKEGKTETTLRINGLEFPVTIEQGWAMYYAVLSYARECWDVTQQHYAAVASIDSVEELTAYDYTTGYPTKLAF